MEECAGWALALEGAQELVTGGQSGGDAAQGPGSMLLLGVRYGPKAAYGLGGELATFRGDAGCRTIPLQPTSICERCAGLCPRVPAL